MSYDGPEDLPLFQNLRQALRSDEPLDFLAIVSSLVEAFDRRNDDPYNPKERKTTLPEFVDSLIGTSNPEMTAALIALQVLIADDGSERIGRELDSRRHPLPKWLSGLNHARIEAHTWIMTHVLNDGDDYLVGVTLSSGQPLSALVYVDHNLGTVVKDAFVVAETLENLVIQLGTLKDDADQPLHRTDAAMARAEMEQAIEGGAAIHPALTSNSWPMCRPLVEWMLRKLPSGGIVPEPKKYTDHELAEIAADFFSTDSGSCLDTPDNRSLLDTLLWFGTNGANRDPFLWSVVTVEMLMMDWVPRRISSEPALLAGIPRLLRAWIRYAHHRVKIRDSLTHDALRAVDHYELRYQRIIISPHPQGPETLWTDGCDYKDDEMVTADLHLEALGQMVGSGWELHVGGMRRVR